MNCYVRTIFLIWLYKKFKLFHSYANLYDVCDSRLKVLFSQYILYKAGYYDLAFLKNEGRCYYLFNKSERLCLQSLINPQVCEKKLCRCERDLLHRNWAGINDYLNSYSLPSFVGDKPWTVGNYFYPRISSEQKVSVIMTVRNAEETVEYAIASVLDQTFCNLELIVVDDYSEDDTYELVKKLARNDKRIILMKVERNLGTYRCRNLALTKATGDFITTHDADDLMHPQHIELLVKSVKGDASHKAAISYWVRFTRDGVVSSARGYPLLRLNLSSFLFKREVLKDIPLWDEFTCGSDLYFFSECLEKYGSEGVVYIKKPLSISLFTNTSLTVSSKTGVFTKEGRKLRSRYEDWWRRKLLKKYHPKILSVINYLEQRCGLTSGIDDLNVK